MERVFMKKVFIIFTLVSFIYIRLKTVESWLISLKIRGFSI